MMFSRFREWGHRLWVGRSASLPAWKSGLVPTRRAVKLLAPLRVLALLCCLPLGGVAASPPRSQRPLPRRQAPEQPVVFGHSVQGRPLRAFVLGHGANVTMIFGGFHGNERSGPGVVERLRAYLQQHPDQWWDCKVILVPYANPDGWKAGTRVNAHQVDLNRNFPGSWSPVVKEARRNPGPSAASEPETRAIMELVAQCSPAKIVSLHQPLHLLNWTGLRGQELAAVMGRDDHYRLSAGVGYTTHGAFGDYCGRYGISVVTLEMPNVGVTRAWQQNREALMAAIGFRESQQSHMASPPRVASRGATGNVAPQPVSRLRIGRRKQERSL